MYVEKFVSHINLNNARSKINNILTFAITASTYVRTPRPSDVQYRVGQTIIHNIWGYRGVIVGWDQYANVSPYASQSLLVLSSNSLARISLASCHVPVKPGFAYSVCDCLSFLLMKGVG